jgi:hypothetical protein
MPELERRLGIEGMVADLPAQPAGTA